VTSSSAKGALDSEALGKLADSVKIEEPTAPKPAQVEPPPPPVAPGKGGRNRPSARARTLQGRGVTAPGPGTLPPAAYANNGDERSVKAIAPTHINRPPPSQGDISRVVNNNKLGIKTCYQRALLRDSSLTHGKIVVGLTIGTSGRVKGTKVDGPFAFRALEPCIKEMVGRWAFPQADEEYGTEFAYVFQGNE
jgi:hypothetical protein